jgi:hypothetical protein
MAAPGTDPYVPVGPFTEEAFPTVETGPLAAGTLTLGAASSGVTAPPKTCADFLKAKAPAAPACGDSKAALAALDAALALAPEASPSEAQVKARDVALAALEGCAGLPSGVVRALRIELLPAACGDVLAEPLLKAPPKDMRADIHEALFGLALAARLGRAGGAAPTLPAPYTRDRVEKFIAGPLGKWMKDVATAVQEMSADATKLHYYGGAIAAVASGVADLALVETVRGAPIPEEFEKDAERKNVYYASLDEKLEPRKARGRNAALVGLKKFAEVGALADSRVHEARRLLSKLYGGRRIDALDKLILPAAPVPPPAVPPLEERLAQRLPTFYAGVLLEPKSAAQPSMLLSLSMKGVPLPQRRALHEEKLGPELAALVARAHIMLGQTYWRASDFEEAAKALSGIGEAQRTPEIKLLIGLSIGLRGGPKDAIEMMAKSPLGMNALGQRAALDDLATQKVAVSGAAAFNSAYLMEISAPEKADGVFFKSLAKRYRAAADLLTDARHKIEAEERAKAVEAIAKQVQ